MKKSMGNWINGLWKQGNGKKLLSVDPGNGTILWEAHESNESDVEEAITTSTKAFKKWGTLNIDERSKYLISFKKKLEEHLDDLTLIIAQETGKPLWDSKTEVLAMIGKIDISIKAYEERCHTKVIALNTQENITRHKPHGVLVVFGPYNFPGHLPNGHIIPALLAGNCVIFKPSEKTPLVAQETVRLWEEAGLPAGVLNLVQGGKETAILLAKHPCIQGILFTGSWETGSIISQQFAKTPGKILALEMGGNNPLVVTTVSDKIAAAQLTILSAYLSSGQRCTCARRLIVPEGNEGDVFIETLVSIIKKIKVGHYSEKPEPFMGPLIDPSAAQNMLKAQDRLIQLKGKPLLPMEASGDFLTYLTPGLLDITAIKEHMDQEFFGPLLQLQRVKNFEEAILEANKTEYGLSATLISDNKNEYEEFYQKINAGIINWNSQTTGASSAAPFGGIGKSGNHRPSAYYAADYCSYPVASIEVKSVSMPKPFPGLSLKEEKAH